MTERVWTLSRLNPLVQPHFLDHVDEFIPEVTSYFPQYLKITRPAKKREPISVLLPVYPGYVFLNLDPNSKSINQILHSPFRVHFVKFANLIATVRDIVIKDLQEKERLNLLVEDKTVEDPYYPGRKVRIILPIATIDGIILSMKPHDQIEVDTDIGPWTVEKTSISLV